MILVIPSVNRVNRFKLLIDKSVKRYKCYLEKPTLQTDFTKTEPVKVLSKHAVWYSNDGGAGCLVDADVSSSDSQRMLALLNECRLHVGLRQAACYQHKFRGHLPWLPCQNGNLPRKNPLQTHLGCSCLCRKWFAAAGLGTCEGDRWNRSSFEDCFTGLAI